MKFKNEKIKKVCIILVNYNGGKKLKDVLESCIMQDYKHKKILVIDNNSTDGSDGYCKGKGVILIKNRGNVGWTAAINQGLRYSLKNKFYYSMLMSNDAVFDSTDVISALVNKIEKNKKLFAVSPNTILFSQKKNEGTFDIFFMKAAKFFGLSSDKMLLGMCMLKNNYLGRVGLLDERFFYCEDLDYAKRIRKKGLLMSHIKNKKIIHDIRNRKIGSFFIYYYTRGFLLFFSKYLSLKYFLICCLLLISILVIILFLPLTSLLDPETDIFDILVAYILAIYDFTKKDFRFKRYVK